MDRIDALRLFTKVAELGSFSAAARECKVKQSTASKWVSELEADFGASLIHRTTRSLRLTPVGDRFLYQARGVLAAFDAMALDFEELTTELSGTLRMTLPVVFGPMKVVTALSEFFVEHEGVHAEIVLSDRYVNLIDEGFDLAIRVGIPKDSSVLGRKLHDSRRVLVASSSYIKCGVSLESPVDLKNHECLLHGEANGEELWKFRQDQGAWQKIKVGGRVRSNNSGITLEMARAGLGIALLADWLVQEDLKRGTLVELLPQFDRPSAPIYLLSPPGRFPSRTVRALSATLDGFFDSGV